MFYRLERIAQTVRDCALVARVSIGVYRVATLLARGHVDAVTALHDHELEVERDLSGF